VRHDLQGGKPGVIFRVEGAERYEILVTSYYFLPAHNSSQGTLGLHNYTPGREFFVDGPQYHIGDEGWRLKADVLVLTSNRSKFSKIVAVTKDTWRARSVGYDSVHPSFLSTAKFFWQADSTRILSEQTLTSDVITNSLLH
jgi:hypothetical protein